MSDYRSNSNLLFMGLAIWANRLVKTIAPPVLALTVLAFVAPLLLTNYPSGDMHSVFIVCIIGLMASWFVLGLNVVSILALHFVSWLAGWEWSDDQLAL